MPAAVKKLDDALYEKRASLSGMTPIPLNAKQKNQWDMTRSALLWSCPAFTHILYTMMAQANGDVALFTDKIPTAATDGATMLINPEWFFKLDLQQRVFIAAHEICHAIFDHCGQNYVHRSRGMVLTPSGKKLEFNPKLLNIAEDLIINDLLMESKVGKFVNGGMHDTSRAIHTDSVIDVYEKLYEEVEKNGGKGGGAGGTGVEGDQLDDHLDPGTSKGQSPTQAQQQRSPMEWETAVAAAASAAKAQGKLPAALERFLKEIMEPEVEWQDKIQAFFARKVGNGSTDWRRPDRRLIVRDIYAPGRSGFGAGTIVIGADTSGSMGDDEIARIFAEMKGILEDVRPKNIFVVWCDAKVHKVDECEEVEDLHGIKPYGGGGTDFRPVFEWIEENGIEPDALVYFTDGIGGFPDRQPKYPVLWGDVLCSQKFPWGDVVNVPVKPKKN